MGAGGKMDPSKAMGETLSKTNNCFFGETNRKRKKEGITKGFRCVFFLLKFKNESSLKLTDGKQL